MALRLAPGAGRVRRCAVSLLVAILIAAVLLLGGLVLVLRHEAARWRRQALDVRAMYAARTFAERRRRGPVDAPGGER